MDLTVALLSLHKEWEKKDQAIKALEGIPVQRDLGPVIADLREQLAAINLAIVNLERLAAPRRGRPPGSKTKKKTT